MAGKLENYNFTHIEESVRPLCDGFYYTHAPATGFTLFEIQGGRLLLKINLEVMYTSSTKIRMTHFFRPDSLYVLLQANGPAVIAFGHALTTCEEDKAYDTFRMCASQYVCDSGNFQFQSTASIAFDLASFTEDMCDQFWSDIDYSMNVVAYDE
jgi:hypothetical protein